MARLITQQFPLFIVGYFILQIVIRLLTTNIAVLDESEQIMLSQYFSLGYNEQPPLYTWIQMGVFKLTGISIFGLSLLKNILLCLTYVFIYQLGILLMEDKMKASLSAVSLFLLPQMVWDAQVDQTHTVFLTTATSITVYLFFYIVKKEASWIPFALLGLSSGVGLLAKYNFILVLIALGGVALYRLEYRKAFYKTPLLLSIAIAFCTVLPHFLWFLSHLDIATNRTVERMSVGHTENTFLNFFKGNGDLLLSIVAFLSPFWLFFILFFKKGFAWKATTETKALILYGVIIFTFLFAMVSLSGTTHIKERWLQPYLVLFPLFLFLHVRTIEYKALSWYLKLCILAPIVVAMVVLIRPFLIDVRGKPTRAGYPFDSITHSILKQISSKDPLLIHAEDKYIGGNLKLFIPHALVITPSLPNQPYVVQKTVVAVWEHEKPLVFLKTLEDQQYECSEKNDAILFKNSKKLIYRIKYMVCKK